MEYGVATHAVYTCNEEVLMRGSDLARKYDSTLHIHTSETRDEVANCHAEENVSCRLLGLYWLFYQQDGLCTLWMGHKERDAHTGWAFCFGGVHCPTSNQKLALRGTMSYPAMIEAGVDVRLGTDGPLVTIHLISEKAKIASLIQRHDHWDASILDPTRDLETCNQGFS